MTNYIEEILAEYQIRKSKKQKAKFAEYAKSKSEENGFSCKVEKGFNKNIIAGDIEKAEIIYTAHYDTCAWMPFPNFIAPMNMWFFPLQIIVIAAAVIIIMGTISLLSMAVTKDSQTSALIGEITIFALLALLLFGPANKHTANDNTSGTAALLMIMEKMPENLKDKTTFVFFDNEEAGLLGSMAFASKYKKVLKGKLIVNMDCISDGDNLMFLCSKTLRKAEEYESIANAIKSFDGKNNKNILLPKSAFYPSDQANFKKTIAVCALEKRPFFGYCIGKIHTHRDTVVDMDNLNTITDIMCSLAETRGN